MDGAEVAQEEATDRPSGKAATQAGMRVALRRDPENERDANAVAVDSLDERTLGYLPSDIAAWVAPLLDSGRMAFDGRIYAVEHSGSESPTGALDFYLALTQFELLPVERSSLALAIQRLGLLPLRGVNWCVGRAAALCHAFGHATARSPRFKVPPRDRYAADDGSGG